MSDLKRLVEQLEHVYLAMDLDREGEAISWYLMEVIGSDISRYSRVVFNEIIKFAIYKNFKNPCLLNINRVHAHQECHFMDRVIGYIVSPVSRKRLQEDY
ncbi:toprim domain-containing protein [Candidatus Erwinia haradaeae]|uniref:toprim domain-containing protein n=1 Tax=Candidatus Erwinia haradaeae TaxID=1922217 RepID=UPI0039E40185